MQRQARKSVEGKLTKRVLDRREQLVDAMERLLREGQLPATMGDLAKAADMSPATAYRYFQSLDEVAQAYLIKVMTVLRDFAVARPESGMKLLFAVTRHWVGMVVEHGPVLVQVRSRRGFLERLHRGVVSTALGVEARRRALLGALQECGLPAESLEDAAMLYNTMFDPREILDLINVRGLDLDRVTHVLIAAFVAALRGWHSGSNDTAVKPPAS